MVPCSSLAVIAALGALAALAGSAVASPESDQLFRAGRDLLKAGKIAEACDSFAASQKLQSKVGTLLNLADCREKQGQTATARALFLEAKQLAAAQRDAAREAEADRRASAVAARLSYLTIRVARDRQVDGLVIKRNGLAVDRAQWNTAVAIDPGGQVIEAAAPKFAPWSTTLTLGVKQSAEVVIEALVAELAPVAAAPVTGGGGGGGSAGARPEQPAGAAPAGAAELQAAAPAVALPNPPVRPLGIGLLGGTSSEQDPLIGARVSAGIAVPSGAVRAIASLLFTQFNNGDENNPDANTKLFAIGLSADYVWMPLPQLGFAAGLGIGQDRFVHDGGSDANGWWTVRLSPVILRFAEGRLEAGAHLQYVRTSDRGVVLVLAGIELFPL